MQPDAAYELKRLWLAEYLKSRFEAPKTRWSVKHLDYWDSMAVDILRGIERMNNAS